MELFVFFFPGKCSLIRDSIAAEMIAQLIAPVALNLDDGTGYELFSLFVPGRE